MPCMVNTSNATCDPRKCCHTQRLQTVIFGAFFFASFAIFSTVAAQAIYFTTVNRWNSKNTMFVNEFVRH